MKLYKCRYAYSKFDHIEIKNLMSQLVSEIRANSININFTSSSDYFLSNNIDYDVDVIYSYISKSLMHVEILYLDRNKLWKDNSGFYLRIKNFKIKLGWYHHNNLWEYGRLFNHYEDIQ